MKSIAVLALSTLCSMNAWSEPDSTSCEPMKSETTIDTATGPVRYQLTVEWSDLAAGPQWQPGEGEIPLSPAKAMELAAASFGTVAKKLRFPVVDLFSTSCNKDGPYWYYQVHLFFQDPVPDGLSGSHSVLVLLSGKVLRAMRVEDGF